MEFKYNRNKTELLRIMKSKGEKKNLKIITESDRVQVRLESGKFSNGEDSIPVVFKGKITESDNESYGCSVTGRFSYGFNLYTLVIVAAALIIARFIWSAYQNQTDNMILCGLVAVILVIVVCIVMIKSKPAEKLITNFLTNLNVK